MLDYDEDDDTEEISDANDDYDDDIENESGKYDDLNNEEEEVERIREKEIKLQKESDAIQKNWCISMTELAKKLYYPERFLFLFYMKSLPKSKTRKYTYA
jgi:hypothetical protein